MASYGQSVTIGYYAYNTSTPAYQTGDATNHTLKLVKDGSEASPTNSPSEVDSTNAPGLYTLTLTTAEAQHNVVILAGKSSTSNVIIIGTQISFEQLPTALTAGGNVKADALDINGVATSSVTTVSAVLGTSQAITFDGNNLPKVDVEDINGSATAGQALNNSTNSICWGTCSGGSTTTAIVSALNNPSSLTASGQLIGRTIIFLGSTGTGGVQAQASNITASTTGSTPTITFTAMTTAPASGDKFVIL